MKTPGFFKMSGSSKFAIRLTVNWSGDFITKSTFHQNRGAWLPPIQFKMLDPWPFKKRDVILMQTFDQMRYKAFSLKDD